jgi:hypothetical protein
MVATTTDLQLLVPVEVERLEGRKLREALGQAREAVAAERERLYRSRWRTRGGTGGSVVGGGEDVEAGRVSGHPNPPVACPNTLQKSLAPNRQHNTAHLEVLERLEVGQDALRERRDGLDAHRLAQVEVLEHEHLELRVCA